MVENNDLHPEDIGKQDLETAPRTVHEMKAEGLWQGFKRARSLGCSLLLMVAFCFFESAGHKEQSND